MFSKTKDFIDSIDAENDSLLKSLESAMSKFYNQKAPSEGYWKHASQCNTEWDDVQFPFHKDLVSKIRNGDTVVDFGCGSANFFANCNKSIRYIGLEWSNSQVEINRKKYPNVEFVQGDITKIYTYSQQADWAISLFVLEHVVRPNLLLDNMLSTLKPTGSIGLICPNFITGMNSIRSGFRATTKRDKLKKLQLLDLLISIVDEKFFIPRTVQSIHRSSSLFPIYLYPRCLDAPYYSDNDAVHLVNEKKVISYLQRIGLRILTSSERLRNSSETLYIVANKANIE
jgi:ubiquinone/menaquinone biosynthesis C-methylase UbiE